jgi:hypothetical protein
VSGQRVVLDLLAPPAAVLLHDGRLYASTGSALCAWSAG